jgi:hypothetical protein
MLDNMDTLLTFQALFTTQAGIHYRSNTPQKQGAAAAVQEHN